jgi:hypothetical protein
VILGKNGVVVYEIPTKKEKLLADNWVDVEDLGVEDDPSPPPPEDVGPIEMTTPEPREKVWLDSNVKWTSPIPYSNLNTMRPTTSTIRTPRARLVNQEARSVNAVEQGLYHL